VVRLKKRETPHYLLRAAAYTQSKIYTGARNDFLMAYGLGKNDPSVAQSIACMYTKLGIADSAATWFFISGNPDCADCVSETNDIDEMCPECCKQKPYITRP